jgi:hypothetical protein
MEGGHILYCGNDIQHHCLFVFGEEEVKAEAKSLKPNATPDRKIKL